MCNYTKIVMNKCIFALVFTNFVLIISNHRVDSGIINLFNNDNADTYLTPLQIIKKHGYPSEAHTVESQNGYILELHRIPYGKSEPRGNKRIPVFLHHGILSSSMDWLINGPNKSLGYRLADEGYDIWLANARGNTFSRHHTKYNPSQREFWNYSFHEIALYDLPAAIDHILKTTAEEQLVYIGHSLGTAVFYAMASMLPEYNKKIKFQISLAPVSAIPHANSGARLLVPHAKTIDKAIEWYGKGAFLERDLMARIMMPIFCGGGKITGNICKKFMLFGVFGKNPEQFDDSLLPLISSNFPAGTSSKNVIHCSQLISSGTFAQYDYGKDENMKRYGSPIPPKYNINKISVPIRLYYSDNDLLSPPLDTKILYQRITKPLGLKRVNLDKFSHTDFLWANDINKLLNDEIIEFIRNATDFENGSDFIQETVTQALDIRSKTPPPVNVPFDEKLFLRNLGKDFVGNTLETIDNAVGNIISNSIKKIQSGGEKVKSYAENILDKIKRKTKSLKDFIG